MTRAPNFALSPLVLSLALGSACTSLRAPAVVEPPVLTPTGSAIAPPELGLPFHSAAIVDLALVPPSPGERWRMISGDLDGWVRIWADGKLLAALLAHPGGLAALVSARDGTVYTAGYDGRIREWPVGATAPSRSFRYGEQVSALAVSDTQLAISDGRFVELWTRADPPELVWTTRAHAFVTGLSLSADASVVAAAELRDSGIRDAIATHPLARSVAGGVRAIGPEQAAELAYLAERDFPGAAADFVEVWQPGHKGSRHLVPQSAIDADLAVFGQGAVAYREIFDRGHGAVYGRRVEDRAHIPVTLVKPWALFSGTAEAAGEPAEPIVNVGDFVRGSEGELIVVDHFPGWDTPPPEWGWRVGERRELAIGYGFAALGDGHGNVAVLDLAQPTEAGWQAPGEERPELIAAAGGQPWLASATLEPRTQYRLWSLLDGRHQAIRVEDPARVIDLDAAARFGIAEGPLYPLALALDDGHEILAISGSSFDTRDVVGVRVLATADGSSTLLSATAKPHAIELQISPDGRELLAWIPGYPSFAWTRPAWIPREGALPSGAPHLSGNGRYAAFVSAFERTIVDRSSGKSLVLAKVEPVVSEVGAVIPAAIANDGTLALVEPFGGGVVQLLALDGSQTQVELPGATTAVAWVDDREGRPVLLVGFQDGSIVRVDREARTSIPIHAGAGGRIWSLAPLGGSPGAFVELDELGLALHRLDDDAFLELHLADSSTLARDPSSPPTLIGSEGLVALWRPGAAMPVCAVLDGSEAGVLVANPAVTRRLGPSEAPEFFAAFLAGQECPRQPRAAAVEPIPL